MLDAFAGGGTTLLAAEKSGRRVYAPAIDQYAISSASAHMWAVSAVSGLTFFDRSRDRQSDADSAQ